MMSPLHLGTGVGGSFCVVGTLGLFAFAQGRVTGCWLGSSGWALKVMQKQSHQPGPGQLMAQAVDQQGSLQLTDDSAHIHAQVHTGAHARTRTCTHTHTHTSAYTHTSLCCQPGHVGGRQRQGTEAGGEEGGHEGSLVDAGGQGRASGGSRAHVVCSWMWLWGDRDPSVVCSFHSREVVGCDRCVVSLVTELPLPVPSRCRKAVCDACGPVTKSHPWGHAQWPLPSLTEGLCLLQKLKGRGSRPLCLLSISGRASPQSASCPAAAPRRLTFWTKAPS